MDIAGRKLYSLKKLNRTKLEDPHAECHVPLPESTDILRLADKEHQLKSQITKINAGERGSI